jgi:hypothetical protein
MKLSVMKLCDMINKIHVSFDEKSIPNMPNQRFHLPDLEGRISVYGRFWSKFEVIDKYEWIIKVDE